MHPRSRLWNLDYVCIGKRNMQNICIVCSLHHEDCWSYHALLQDKLRMGINYSSRSQKTVRLPKCLECSNLYVNIGYDERQNIWSYQWDRWHVIEKSRDRFGEIEQAECWFSCQNNICSRMMQKDLSKFQEQLTEALKRTMADTQHIMRSI